jgi:hypothetical protein
MTYQLILKTFSVVVDTLESLCELSYRFPLIHIRLIRNQETRDDVNKNSQC